HVSSCDGDLFCQRILGQSCIADDDRSGRDEGSTGFSFHANLFHVQHATRNWERCFEGQLSAVSESSRFAGSAASAVYCFGQMGHGRDATTPKPVPETLGWYVGQARSKLNRIPSHTRRHIHGAQNNTVFAELRAALLHNGNSDD